MTGAKCIWKIVCEEMDLTQLINLDSGYQECNNCTGFAITKECYIPIDEHLRTFTKLYKKLNGYEQ